MKIRPANFSTRSTGCLPVQPPRPSRCVWTVRGATRRGWQHLRRTLGDQIAIVEVRREHSIYRLSDEFNDGAQYMFWQTKHLLTRVTLARATVRQLQAIGGNIPEVGESLDEAAQLLSGAWSQIRAFIRTLAVRAGVDDDELKRVLAQSRTPELTEY